jgi:hypothetical protein
MESIALLKWIIWKKRWFFHSLTVSSLAKVAIFTTNVDAENQTLINHK